MHSKKIIKTGFIWSLIDSVGAQGIGLVVTLILAQMLGPHAYGLVAMLAIFISVANVFVNSGFSAALIRKKDRNEADLSTTFYFSLAVSISSYGVLFLAAPYISIFFNQPELIPLTRALGLVIVINPFAVIARVLLTVDLNFKAQAKASIASVIVSGMIALSLAYKGYGVWALVAQQLISCIVSVIVLNLLSPWRPASTFCRASFDELFGFGSKLLASGLLDTIYNNVYSIIIGKQFSALQLGIFNQANTLSSMPAITLTAVIQKVTYPMLSAIQDDTKKLDAIFLLTLQFTAAVIFPIMLGISIVAEPLISLLLGLAWLGSAKLISIISLGFMLYPIHAINLNLLQVKGRSDLFLRLEVIKKVIITMMLIITVPMGINAICIGMVVTSYLAFFLNTYYTGQLSSLTVCSQSKAIVPIGVIAAVSAIIGQVVGSQSSGDILQIITMLTVALTVYAILMYLAQRKLIMAILQSVNA